MSASVLPLTHTPRFNIALGSFYTAWMAADLLVDFALKRFLRISAEAAHHITAGNEFGRKARLLNEIIKLRQPKNQATLLPALGKLWNDSKRNVLAHSYLLEHGDGTFSFLERKSGGGYEVKTYRFSLEEFEAHVRKVLDDVRAFRKVLRVTDLDLTKFAVASLSASRKAAKSPKPRVSHGSQSRAQSR